MVSLWWIDEKRYCDDADDTLWHRVDKCWKGLTSDDAFNRLVQMTSFTMERVPWHHSSDSCSCFDQKYFNLKLTLIPYFIWNVECDLIMRKAPRFNVITARKVHTYPQKSFWHCFILTISVLLSPQFVLCWFVKCWFRDSQFSALSTLQKQVYSFGLHLPPLIKFLKIDFIFYLLHFTELSMIWKLSFKL